MAGRGSSNPRRANGHRRDSVTRWLRQQRRPCWICGLPIDYSLPSGEAGSFVCDELVPVAKGGSPTSRSNVAAAHACCNSWRGAKSISQVEAVRGRVLELFGGWSSPSDFVGKARAQRFVRLDDASKRVETTTAW